MTSIVTARARALVAAGIVCLAFPAVAQVNPTCPMAGQGGGCALPTPLQPLNPALQPKFYNELPIPVAYTPDTDTFPGFDYYEIQMAPVTQAPVAFPQPAKAPPAGSQWLGLCATFNAVNQTCTAPIFTPVWGYGQVNAGGGPLGGIATYPAMSFRATKGRPVKVRWINNAPDQHLFCPAPQDSNVPCAIDRTLMGTLVRPGESVGPFGSPQQPDNAMVVHLHGGEIPPDSDGMAELWIGNGNTSLAYARASTPLLDSTGAQVPGVSSNIDPAFTPPPGSGLAPDAQYPSPANGPDPMNALLASLYAPDQLVRPSGSSVYYNYPMVQDSATIWYHDHALGKTRVNVAAGPAGFFIVGDPAVDGPNGTVGKLLPPTGDCSVSGTLNGLCYDIPVALQDRAFNADGTINFPNGLGQVAPAGVVGWNALTPGPNPAIHPQWVPEYFGDVSIINGVAWPKLTVDPRPYRFRLLDGSNARCWTLSLKVATSFTPPPITQIASDQGYLPAPAPASKLTLCPGERAEVVIDFSAYAGQKITMINSASAPFPAGISPQASGSPYGQVGQVMQFQVLAKPRAGSPAAAPWKVPVALATVPPLPIAGVDPVTGRAVVAREMVLNEVLDPVTLAPLRVQIDGKPFEATVTETPRRRSVETWTFINTTVDAHPIHLHLVQFQVVSRQKVDVNKYGAAIGLANLVNGGGLTKVPVAPYLMGKPRPAPVNEKGWKDTAVAYPGEVLTVVARWDGRWQDAPVPLKDAAGNPVIDPTTQQPVMDASIPYWEAVTSGPYVWHCHIVDHEDNEMMRPTLVMP
jgi:spore coat protein A, manganese oxidase